MELLKNGDNLLVDLQIEKDDLDEITRAIRDTALDPQDIENIGQALFSLGSIANALHRIADIMEKNGDC
jgi:hypothetical protein